MRRERGPAIDAAWKDVTPRRAAHPGRLVAFGLLGATIVVLAYVVVQSVALPSSTSPSTVPKVQTLARAGDAWNINATAPRVVDFATSGPAVVWMNASLHNGISVFLCPSNVAILPMSTPGFHCIEGAGGAEHLNGSWEGIHEAGSWELAFINYGPQDGYLSTVTVTWLAPLQVVET